MLGLLEKECTITRVGTSASADADWGVSATAVADTTVLESVKCRISDHDFNILRGRTGGDDVKFDSKVYILDSSNLVRENDRISIDSTSKTGTIRRVAVYETIQYTRLLVEWDTSDEG